MKRLIFLSITLLVSMLAQAQIYQWKDKDGRVVISDRPPIDAKAEQKRGSGVSSSSSSPAPEQKSLSEQEMEFRKRRKEAQEKEEKEQKTQAQAQQKQKYCAGLKNRLQTYQSGERIALRDDKGERYFLEDNQRAQEIQEMQQQMEQSCQ
ncbi:MAG: DUF4124 domain-containing protein [Candidatus Accumulibacter sp.]|jgi:hypothetical protein|nr:DUF4124 domain-containing protein [Accumulibacter sp.]